MSFIKTIHVTFFDKTGRMWRCYFLLLISINVNIEELVNRERKNKDLF